jgi:hypothetical protein
MIKESDLINRKIPKALEQCIKNSKYRCKGKKTPPHEEL